MQNIQTSTFPERLRTILNETGIRQTDLCEKAGIGKSAMSQYLHGAFIPKQAKLSAIAEALGVSEGWLMGYDVPRMRSANLDKDGNGIDGHDRYIEMLAPDNSMQSAHIPQGARVILRKLGGAFEKAGGEELPAGEIVCITIDGSSPQLRFLHQDGDKLLATAADIGYAPQVFGSADLAKGTVEILGVVEKVEIKF
ncbi:MAG: helix-turn-helix domain-containing protein [Firmicutes bacterium]|nr:helix-turn-helix domain-containing protein [Bacillota bacterium]